MDDLQAYAHTCFHLYADRLANDGMNRWLKDNMSHTNPILMSALSPGMLQEEPAQTTNMNEATKLLPLFGQRARFVANDSQLVKLVSNSKAIYISITYRPTHHSSAPL